MWPFKKKSAADTAVEWLPLAIDAAAEKWLHFQSVKFRADVSLEERIMIFMVPFQQGLRQWKAYQNSPEAVFLLIVAKGIEKSGTHSVEQIERALGLTLPRS